MSLPKITSYEVKTSRTEQKVPVVNGVHLHSIYNPFKEADSLVEGQIDSLKLKSEVLILGLGFAYHVNAISEKLQEIHGNNFKIIIIEPNIQVYEDCLANNLLNKKNILVYAGFNPNELYSDVDFIHFLLRKPAIVAHPPSFNLYQYYYKTILTFEAPKTISGILGFVENEQIKQFLKKFDTEDTLENILYKIIPHKKTFDETDFLAMALVEMTKKSIEIRPENGDR